MAFLERLHGLEESCQRFLRRSLRFRNGNGIEDSSVAELVIVLVDGLAQPIREGDHGITRRELENAFLEFHILLDPERQGSLRIQRLDRSVAPSQERRQMTRVGHPKPTVGHVEREEHERDEHTLGEITVERSVQLP